MIAKDMTIDDQMAYLLKGAAEVINEEELRKKLEKSQRDRQAADGEGGL